MDKASCPATSSSARQRQVVKEHLDSGRNRSWVGGFWIADLEREKNTRELFDEIIKAKPTSGNDGPIADCYNAYVNANAIDRAGLTPPRPTSTRSPRIADKPQLRQRSAERSGPTPIR